MLLGTVLFALLKNKLVLIPLIIIVFILIGYLLSDRIQQYTNILGYSTNRCSSKLDLNCDLKINLEDLGAFKTYLVATTKKTGTTPAPEAPTKTKPNTDPQPTPEPDDPKDNPTPDPDPEPEPDPEPSPEPDPTPEGDDPYPGAPACPDSAHSNGTYHSLWNSQLKCHYDHEHGQDPSDDRITETFPGFNLRLLSGGFTVGHTNPSSSMENTHKHGGFKWQFMPRHPETCAGFEGATNGVNGSAIQVHGFGDYNMELMGRIHSSSALLRMCNQANPTDYGYLYTVQFQDYGQIVSPYQGDIIPFPFTPNPAYDPARGPYLTIDCVGQKAPGERGACRTSLEQVLSRGLNANSNWSAKPTGSTNINNPLGSTLFNVFFRLRDTYQLIDWSDKTHPFTYKWLCSEDEGDTYDPEGCEYNNSTIQVHELAGKIPTSWDNLQGFDSDSRTGRITATGYTDRYGTLKTSCTTPSVGANGDRNGDCFPIKMVNAFVGSYGSILVYTDPSKGDNLVQYLPEKDIYFCDDEVCEEGDAGAKSSGWIGQNN